MKVVGAADEALGKLPPIVQCSVWVMSGLLCLELLLRVALVSPSAQVFDPTYGSRTLPHARIIQSDEGYTRAITNSDGYLDDEATPTASGRRVLLVGDSYSEAKQVAPSAAFHRIAEQYGADIEIINTARGGWYQPHYLHWLGENASKYHPDLILIQVNDGDLLQFSTGENFRWTRDEHSAWAMRVPHPIQPTGSSYRLRQWMMHHSSLFTFAYRRAKILLTQEEQRLKHKFVGVPEPSSSDSSDAVEWMRSLHAEFLRLGVPIVYLYIPQISYDKTPAEPKYPDSWRMYQEFASDTEVDLLDATEVLLNSFAESGQPGHGFHNSVMGGGHMNARGHLAVGRFLATALRERLP